MLDTACVSQSCKILCIADVLDCMEDGETPCAAVNARDGSYLSSLFRLPWAILVCSEGCQHVFHRLKHVPSWVKPYTLPPQPMQAFRLLTSAIRHSNLPAATQILEAHSSHSAQHLVKVSNYMGAAAGVYQKLASNPASLRPDLLLSMHVAVAAVELALLVYQTTYLAWYCALVAAPVPPPEVDLSSPTAVAEVEVIHWQQQAQDCLHAACCKQASNIQHHPLVQECRAWCLSVRACLLQVCMDLAYTTALQCSSLKLQRECMHDLLAADDMPALHHAMLLATEHPSNMPMAAVTQVLCEFVSVLEAWGLQVPAELAAYSLSDGKSCCAHQCVDASAYAG